MLTRLACILVAWGLGLLFQSTSVLAQSLDQATPRLVEGTPFERYIIDDGSGRKVTYYLSRPRTGVAPLMLMIQGSGCLPVFVQRDGKPSSTLFNMIPFAHESRFAVLVVDKPFAGEERPAGQPCSADFNRNFTAESWLHALQASLTHARKANWIDLRRTLVFGHSEGAVMATLLAASDGRVTDAVVIGGSGTTQLYDFIVHAHRTCFDVPRCVADVEIKARAIASNPDSATDFAWGHPFKRWTSFFRVDPGEALLRSKARVYIAFGTADQAVPAFSQEIMVAKLLAAGRDVTVRRVPDADHSLRLPFATDHTDTDIEYRAALEWFWQADTFAKGKQTTLSGNSP